MDAVIGNSSSGVLEAPTFKIPTINIGDRQIGRVMAKSVINVQPISNKICDAINLALSNKFKQKIKNLKSPYDKKNTSLKVFKTIKQIKKIDLKKDFVDSYI